MMKIGAVTLIVLSGIDGHEVRVNPSQIAALHSPRPDVSADKRLYSEKANCIISLADGKNLQVVESCFVIQRMLEDLK